LFRIFRFAKTEKKRPHEKRSEKVPAAERAQANSARREILRIGLRESLLRNGIPSAWISVEGIRSKDSRGAAGTQVWLKIHHRDVRLCDCLPALEADFRRRIALLDRAQVLQLHGISWQFALPKAEQRPTMPHPGSWFTPLAQPVPRAHAKDAPRTRAFAATMPAELMPAGEL